MITTTSQNMTKSFSTHPKERLHFLRVKQGHTTMVAGDTGPNTEYPNTADQRGNIPKGGPAIPRKVSE